MASRFRALLVNLGVSCATVIVCLLVVELALRVAARPAKGGKEQFERNRYMESDPVLGWRKTPGAPAIYDRRDYHTEFVVNAKGLRGPDRPYEKPGGIARVLVLGDSFTEAYMVADELTVAARLEAKLRSRSCRVEVVNGGTSGYSTDQEYLFYREEGRKYAPDVVVLFAYHNDLPYLTEERYFGLNKPRLSFEQRPPTVANFPVPPQVPGAAPIPPPAPTPRSYLAEFLKDRLETSARSYGWLASLGLLEPLRILPMNEELLLYHSPKMQHTWRYWSAFTYAIQALAAAVNADRRRLLVAYIPCRFEVNPQDWQFTLVRHGLDEREYSRDAVGDEVGRTMQKLGIPFLDLRAPLRSANGLFTPVFFNTDVHWNARGQDVAAGALATRITAAGLPGCP